MFCRSFHFGLEKVAGLKGKSVRASDYYSAGKGYGFVVEKNRREQDLLKLPELNSAFDTIYWYQGEDLSHVEEDAFGCFLNSDQEIICLEEENGKKFAGEHRRIPFSFKTDVPCQGNYKVTVTIRTPEDVPESGEEVLIFTGRRRLGYRGSLCTPGEKVSAKAEGAEDLSDLDITGGNGQKSRVFTWTMTVNVCDIIPRGHRKVYTDKSVDITVVGDRPRLSEIIVEETECPTIFIAGDSTVTDQSADYPYAPGTSYCGWGQMISAYLNGKVAVSNHAHSGLTTASFREEGHYEIIEKYIRPGDYLFLQFAHNDQKLDELKAEEGYRQNLLRYIRECREKGAFPVLVTPIARNTWKGNDGSYNDLLEEYAKVCICVGEQEDVPVIDLHRRSMDFILEKGLEAAKAYFFPGDYTHSNDYGAYYMAGLAAAEMKRVCGIRREAEYRLLADCVTQGFGPWEAETAITLPVKPEKYEYLSNPDGVELLADVEDLSDTADRVAALDMVIRTVKFFPTNVYNDMFRDVIGHEWYAGTVECAWQNGMIDGGLVEDGKFYPLRPVTLEEFLIFAVNGYKSRKVLPDAEGSETIRVYDEKCRIFARPCMRAACSLGLIAPDGSEDPGRILNRGEVVELCRKLGRCIGG